jgi:hypothetical protein
MRGGVGLFNSFYSAPFQASSHIKPEIFRLGATEVRKVGPEIWFMNESQLAWTHIGNIVYDLSAMRKG